MEPKRPSRRRFFFGRTSSSVESTKLKEVGSDGIVHRLRPQPEAAGRGRLIVTEQTLEVTSEALRAFRGRRKRHEGIVFWGGRQVGNDTVVVSALVPQADHGPGHVHVSHDAVGWMGRSARSSGIALMAQVHSHPGLDTRHSDGDDDLIVLPREGMFSLVVGRYGDAPVDPRLGAGLHQYQDGRWVYVTTAHECFVLVPSTFKQ